MPGIVGLVTKIPRESAEERLHQMVKALQHESFYDIGTWIDDSQGVYLGWANRKNSFSEKMPIKNEEGSITLVFSGEDFPDGGTASHLKSKGHSFDGSGPSYLVHHYEDDLAFPASLNGMFQGFLVDQRRGTAMLFNDRYGMHRVYYYEAKDAFYFAAEAKAILAVLPELRTPDLQGLGEFVAYSCVLENRTIFRDIRLLPGGSAWSFAGGVIEKKATYFQPTDWEEQGTLDPEAFYQELKNVLSTAIPRYFEGCNRVGMTLTGGLDTRVIIALHKPAPYSLPCYTYGGTRRETQDVRIARQVANVCHQSHEVITVGQEFLSQFPHYAERAVYLTEGGVDVSRSSDLYFSENARKIAPVKVVGTYGSEIVRQAVMFKPMAFTSGLYSQGFLPHLRHAECTYANVRAGHPVTFAAFRQSPWYHYGILSLEQSQLSVRSPYLDNNFVRVLFQAPKDEDANNDVRLRLVREANPALASLRTDRGVGGDSNPISAAIIRAFLEFTIKSEYAYDYGMPQWVAKVDHMASWLQLERLFLGRHKSLYFRVWYRDVLSAYVREMLLDPQTLSRPYIDRKTMQSIVAGHLNGTQNHTTEIHKLLTLEIIHRLFFDAR